MARRRYRFRREPERSGTGIRVAVVAVLLVLVAACMKTPPRLTLTHQMPVLAATSAGRLNVVAFLSTSAVLTVDADIESPSGLVEVWQARNERALARAALTDAHEREPAVQPFARQLEVDRRGQVSAHAHLFLRLRPVADERRLHAIRARPYVQDVVVAVDVGDGALRRTDDGHVHAGHRLTGRSIGDLARDFAGLCPRRRWQQQDKQHRCF